MSKIRVLSDHLANQIAAGEVVERPASVAKELVENAIDAGATRIEIEVEAGGRRLLSVRDDGEGMTRDDALLAFERHATSKLATTEYLNRIATLGFRGEALASIASVARVELHTKRADEADATRVFIEGGRMRDVSPVAHPTGTTLTVRDLFFNVPARRKFLRSEATESYHLTNLVTHYALAHPEISFTLTNNGRETIHAASAPSLRERAYQIFGGEFIRNLLEVAGGHEQIARVTGFVSAPRDRRTSRDAQYLFVNGRYVRDRLVARALMDGYRTVLPHGSYPAALLFLAVPFEEVDVNVHPAKTEVRFRRAAAIADAVRENVRQALAHNGYVRIFESGAHEDEPDADAPPETTREQSAINFHALPSDDDSIWQPPAPPATNAARNALTRHADAIDDEQTEFVDAEQPARATRTVETLADIPQSQISNLKSEITPPPDDDPSIHLVNEQDLNDEEQSLISEPLPPSEAHAAPAAATDFAAAAPRAAPVSLPPFDSAAHLVREVAVETLSSNIRPLGQLHDSFIIATDDEGLLLIDQHVAHERILFDKFRRRESARTPDSQHLLIPETFDLSPAQAVAFDLIADELDSFGFGLMRLSGRTLAVKSVPAELPMAEARNLLAEILDTIEAERRGTAQATLRDRIAASLACRAAVKITMPLSPEKQQWLIDRVLLTVSPTTCPHGRPVILRLRTSDILKGFHRT